MKSLRVLSLYTRSKWPASSSSPSLPGDAMPVVQAETRTMHNIKGTRSIKARVSNYHFKKVAGYLGDNIGTKRWLIAISTTKG